MAVSKSDIKLYLTSLLPDVEQTIFSQSLGGYPGTVNGSPTTGLIYDETTLSDNLPSRFTTINLTDYTQIENVRFITIGGELIDATSVTSATPTGIRASNNIRATHVTGDIVRGVTSGSNFFDDHINESFKQYRCIAVKNNNSTDTASNFSVYIANNSRNPGSKIRIAIEQPRADYRADTIDTALTVNNQFRIADLVGSFEDNHFVDCYVRFLTGNLAGQERTIISYDSETGIFTLDSSLSESVQSGSTIEIEPSPAQRVVSGVNKPYPGSRLTVFTEASEDDAVNINVTGDRDHGFDLQPNDVVYVWVERAMSKNSTSFSNNSITLGFNFTAS